MVSNGESKHAKITITLDAILNFRTLRHGNIIEWDFEIGVLDMGIEAFRKFSTEPEIDPEIEYFV